MSKTIDQRVVSLEFDNSRFQKNASSTVSMLEKLKEKLNFNGATKSLSNISTAANKVNLSGINSAVDTVHAKFSALDVVAVTAMANIANSAVNAGKRIVNALTLEPVMSGFQEYETQINAIQTILANTQSKGSTLEDVNKALDELNKYADQTIYNFTEMTRNIGTFTAAGVDLDKSVTSIKGIANLAAVSGSNAQQASTAMYQLSQAIASGRVALQDWNSVVNAGMGGELFQNALKRTAKHFGTNVDAMIKKYGSFRESLTRGGWLTTEILTETLTQLSGAYSEADLIAQGYSKKQAQEIAQLAETAVNAATKVKTFSQLFDTLKEAAQSGWTQTWEYIIGDFNQAQSLLTSISDTVGGWINAMSDARNAIIGGAFDSAWSQLEKKINDCGVSTEKFQKELSKVAKTHGLSLEQMIKKEGSLNKVIEKGLISKDLVVEALKNIAGLNKKTAQSTEDLQAKLKKFQKVVSDVWKGDYKNVDTGRIEALKKAGYEYKEVQELVNKTVNDHKLDLEDLTDSQLKAVGYTEKEIEGIKKLAVEAEKSGTPLNSLIERLNKPSGRELFWESFANMAQPVITILKAFNAAWNDAFPSDGGSFLYSIIEAFHNFTEYLKIGERQAENLTRTLKGVFAVIDIVANIVGKVLGLAFTVASKAVSTFWRVLGFGNSSILEITALMGDALVSVRDFIEGLSAKEMLSAFVNFIKNFSVEEMVGIGRNIVDGLVKGVSEGVGKIIEAVTNIAKSLIDTVKAILGIHSPATTFIEIGQYVMEGLFIGLQNGFDLITNFAQGIVNVLLSIFSSISFGDVFILGSLASTVFFLNKMANIMDKIASPFEGFGNVLDGFGNVLDSVAGNIDARTKNLKSEYFLNLAKAIAILAGSLIALSLVDPLKLWNAVAVVTALGVGLTAMMKATERLNVGAGFSFAKLSVMFLGLSSSMMVMSLALKLLSTIDWKQGIVSLGLMTGMMGAMAGFFIVYGKFVSGPAAKNVANAGKVMRKMATSLLVMAVVMKILATISPTDAAKGVAVITVISLLFAGLSVLSLLAFNGDKVAKMMTKMALAIGVLVLVMKLIAGMEPSAISKGLAVITGITVLFERVIATSFWAGANADKAGKMLTKMAIAIGILALTMKLIATMSLGDIAKGGIVIAGCLVLFQSLVKLSNLPGNNADKAGTMILKMGVAIGAIAIAMRIMAGLSLGDAAKGIAIIAACEFLFTGVIAVSKLAGEHASKAGSMLMKMGVAIGILAVAIKILAGVSVGDVIKGGLAVSEMMVVMGAIVALSYFAGEHADKAGTMLLKMSFAIGILAGVIALLSFLDQKKVASATACISALILTFSLLTKMTSSLSGTKGIIGPLLVLSGAIAILAGILYLLQGLPVESTLANAAALSTLMIALSASMLIISKSGTVAPTALLAMGALTLIVGALGGILYLLQGMDPNTVIPIATGISTLLLSMSAVLGILTLVGLGGPAAFIGLGALATLIVGLGTIMAGLGALTTYFPQLEEFLNKGIGLLEAIGNGLGSFFGGIVNGFATAATEGLPAIATKFSEFMTNLKPFIDGAANIDPSMAEGVKNLAQAMLYITGANIIEAATSWLTGGDSMVQFAQQLVPFGYAMLQYSNVVSGVNAAVVQASATAGKALTELANTIPNTGGLISFLTGDNRMDEFGMQLVVFGKALMAYSLSVTGLNAEVIQNSATAGGALVELAKTLPNTGGLISFVMGQKDMAKFGVQLAYFGKGLQLYSQSVQGLQIEAIDNSVKAAEKLVTLSNTIPEDGGFWSWLTGGDKDIGSFGNKLVPFGQGLVAYSNAVGPVSIEAVSNSVTAANKLVAMVRGMNGVTTEGSVNFTKAINSLAKTNVKGFLEAFGSANAKFISAGAEALNGFINGLKSKQGQVKSTMTSIAGEAVKAINSKKSDFNKAGDALAKELVKGLDKQKSEVKKSSEQMAKAGKDGARGYYDEFYDAGKYVAQGFANGIHANRFAAAAKAKAMANAAADAAKKALDEHSPSKVFYGIGDFAGLAFVNALGDYVKVAYRSGRDMANGASDGLSNAMASIASVLSTDVDSQPTIRPVLDLADIEAGAGRLNSLFADSRAVSLTGRLNALSGSVGRNQNGTNNDVVYAIDKLKKSIDKLENSSTTYSIGGITYSNGDEIAETIKELVRIAKIERRV